MFKTGAWDHFNPVRIEFASLDSLVKHVNSKHVLLVTTPGFVKRGIVQQIKKVLEPCKVTVWHDVRPNPDLQDLDVATSQLRQLSVESVIGLGGGSALDSAKVLATTIPSSVSSSLAHVFRDNSPPQWAPRLPLVAIPTTSGTGSEVTPFATIWDHEQHVKYSLSGDFVYPDVALLDPSLTLTLGEEDTLYPALDTISHALESLWNKNSTPLTRVFSFNALSLISQALPIVLNEPKNISARYELMLASTFAGISISQTRTAIAHSLSYPLTMHCGVPHGLACSFPLLGILNTEFDNLGISPYEDAILKKIIFILEDLDLGNRISNYIKDVNISELFISIDSSRSKNYTGDASELAASYIRQLIHLASS